jgi:hypothetical protein
MHTQNKTTTIVPTIEYSELHTHVMSNENKIVGFQKKLYNRKKNPHRKPQTKPTKTKPPHNAHNQTPENSTQHDRHVHAHAHVAHVHAHAHAHAHVHVHVHVCACATSERAQNNAQPALAHSSHNDCNIMILVAMVHVHVRGRGSYHKSSAPTGSSSARSSRGSRSFEA